MGRFLNGPGFPASPLCMSLRCPHSRCPRRRRRGLARQTRRGILAGPAFRAQKSLKSVRDWRRVLEEIRPDVVVLVYGTLWMLPWHAAAAAWLARVPKLYAIQHLMPQPPPEPLVLKIRAPRDVMRPALGRRVRRILSARIQPNLSNQTICVSNAV